MKSKPGKSAAAAKPAAADPNRAAEPKLAEFPIHSENALSGLVIDASTRAQTLASFHQAGDRSVIPAMLQIMRFARLGRVPPLQPGEAKLLRELSGQDLPASEWDSWMNWLWREGQISNHAGFPFLQRHLYAGVHPDFMEIFNPQAPAEIDRAEIIPRPDFLQKQVLPLSNPKIAANGSLEAGYLHGGDFVAGIEVNGEPRAYPLRLLNSHEVVNDVIAGQPVVVIYNPFARTVFAYEKIPSDQTIPSFHYTGLFYRADALIYDLETKSLWSSTLGAPITGKLCRRNDRIRLVPITVTQTHWAGWRRMHYDTTVLSIDTGYNISYDFPNIYNQYYNNAAAEIPMLHRDNRLEPKERVFGIVISGGAVAYPYKEIGGQSLIQDDTGGEGVTIVAAAHREEFRAYKSGTFFFSGGAPAGYLREAQTQRLWRLHEDRLAHGMHGAAELSLDRIPGVVTYWYAWQLWHPETRVFRSTDASAWQATYPGVAATAEYLAQESPKPDRTNKN